MVLVTVAVMIVTAIVIMTAKVVVSGGNECDSKSDGDEFDTDSGVVIGTVMQ